jgi:NAD(P)-dependent dehydrogenase (short-subunit alcohol dehydrogenase family)
VEVRARLRQNAKHAAGAYPWRRSGISAQQYRRSHDARVIILGGTSGLGFATAQAAAREGAHLAIASSSRERVDRAVAELPAGTEGFVVDVTREDDIARLFTTIGPFDHMVFTAGESLTLNPLHAMRLDAAREAFNRRYWAHSPQSSMAANRFGAADRSCWQPVPRKTDRARGGPLPPVSAVRSMRWRALSRSSWRRSASMPYDIAEAYLYLMRERFSTGQVITVDGGTLLVWRRVD